MRSITAIFSRTRIASSQSTRRHGDPLSLYRVPAARLPRATGLRRRARPAAAVRGRALALTPHLGATAARLAGDLPRTIGTLGCSLAAVIEPWGRRKRATAFDSAPLRTSGGVWHTKHREAGQVPHTTIDTEAGWNRSGCHGWWYGWKLHLTVMAGTHFIPVAAEVTVANTSSTSPSAKESRPSSARPDL
jgi:hypothetical protein